MAPEGDSEKQGWTDKNATKFDSKEASAFYDPCQDAANRSIKCLHRNGGDRDMCQDYFQAYRDCKKQWIEARKEAKRKEGKFVW